MPLERLSSFRYGTFQKAVGHQSSIEEENARPWYQARIHKMVEMRNTASIGNFPLKQSACQTKGWKLNCQSRFKTKHNKQNRQMIIFSLSEICTVYTILGDSEIAQWLENALHKHRDHW